MLSGYYFSWW